MSTYSSSYRAGAPGAAQRRHPATLPLTVFAENDGMGERAALKLDIGRALHLWPSEIDLADHAGIARARRALLRAIRTQRRHIRAAHWAYDLSVHARLLDLDRRLALIDQPSPELVHRAPYPPVRAAAKRPRPTRDRTEHRVSHSKLAPNGMNADDRR